MPFRRLQKQIFAIHHDAPAAPAAPTPAPAPVPSPIPSPALAAPNCTKHGHQSLLFAWLLLSPKSPIPLLLHLLSFLSALIYLTTSGQIDLRARKSPSSSRATSKNTTAAAAAAASHPHPPPSSTSSPSTATITTTTTTDPADTPIADAEPSSVAAPGPVAQTAAATTASSSPDASPDARTLTPPATAGALNSMQGRANTVSKQVLGRAATIRSVPSLEGFDSSPESKHSSGFSSSVNSKTSGLSVVESNEVDDASSPSPGPKLKSETMTDTPMRWSTNGLRAVELQQQQPSSSSSPPPQQDTFLLSDGVEQENGQWDSTIGKAGLGKTGRVINKLVSDNDALKREIQIERLRAEEAKQAAKLVEDKMERMVSDYESRLLEANVTKTLLARKERQVETLTATVELEKKKAQAAQELERGWRDEIETVKREAKTQVDDATSYAQLMEGRYNAISSHWRDQGDEVHRAVSMIQLEINSVVEERRLDDDKIQTLRDLCEQQDSNIKELRREKEEIARLFEEYKKTQEDDLRDLKTNARKREEEQERLLEEARATLEKLRWALNVKKNVKGAE